MMGFGMFSVMETIFPLVFLLVFGIILFALVSGIRQWNKNNHSPVLSVWASVVNMRGDVSHHHHADNHMSHSSTTYYVTFQVESGDRIELRLSGQEYGQIAMGDDGKLTFQGTRFLGFERPRLK